MVLRMLRRDSWKEGRRLKFVGRDGKIQRNEKIKKKIRKRNEKVKIYTNCVYVTFAQDNNIGKLDVFSLSRISVYSDLVQDENRIHTVQILVDTWLDNISDERRATMDDRLDGIKKRNHKGSTSISPQRCVPSLETIRCQLLAHVFPPSLANTLSGLHHL